MLVRFVLFFVLSYLVIKLIRDFISGGKKKEEKLKDSDNSRKVSKDVGEYVDYEEVGKKDRRKK